jgi:hypothetical protein
MGYELAFEARHIETNGEHVDDVDHLAAGAALTVFYTVENAGDEAVPDHYDFLSVTDNALTVEYEDWAQRDTFELCAERAFAVPIVLAPGIHWVFVTVDGGGTTPKVAARVVIVAADDTERSRLLEELSG